jgi:hypothetical protein
MTVVLPTSGALLSGPVTFNGGNGVNTLILDANGQPVRVVINGFNGTQQAVNYTAVQQTQVNNAGGINAFYGPDTADRPTALAGLTPQKRFVQVLYLNAMGRAGSDAELQYWVDLLNAPGGSQATVAAGIEYSLEARLRLVKTWYRTFLGRTAGNDEALYWAVKMQGAAPQTEEQVLSGILGSSEFSARAQTLVPTGSAPERYVQALYLLLLNRTAGADEVAFWVGALPSLGNAGAALGILRSQEFRRQQVEAYYTALLHRPGETADRDFWTSAALDLAAIRIGFESSSEFFSFG